MRILRLLTGLLFVFCFHAGAAAIPGYDDAAEKFYTDGSYSKAHDLYQQSASIEKLTAAQKRWVDFRLADTLWRSESATQNSDTTQLDNARKGLEVLIRDVDRTEDRDRVWAEVEESLGDYYWTRRNSQDWGSAWPHYQAALDWWAGAADLELARTRYLKIVWTLAKPPHAEPYYYYGYYGQMLPMEILENALKIAQSENDKAHAHFLVAMTLRNQANEWDQRQRVPEEFEAAIKPGKSTDWYDDALFNYAQWMESNGRALPLKTGGWQQEPDYVRALELYRQHARDFKKGESRYYDQTQQQIKNITEPTVNVGLANIFLPDSEIQYNLNWRNVKKIQFALYPVDLTHDVSLAGDDNEHNNWLQAIDLAGRKATKTWTRDTKDDGKHKPGYETVRLDGKLPAGAYVLEAKSGGQESRDLLLVTDASIILKTSGKQALVYVCDALAGAPIAETKLHLWERYYEDNHWHWRDATKTADKDGIAVFDLVREANNEQFFVSAISKDRQAFDVGNKYYYGRYNQNEAWKIYAFTDRPAYRPGETAQWKFIARQYDGSVYSTPSEQTVEFEIHDPRGAKVKEDKVTLNAFGSAWGSLELKDTMPLGEYRIDFWDKDRKHSIGNATLFRLEEYKLPEFKVTVQMPEENGRKKAFRLGEKVQVDIQADYYFGGAVADADVEVVVHQSPFFHYWHRPHDYAWFYDDMSEQFQRDRYWGGDQVIKREKLKTDATGKATLTFETPRNEGQDLEYRIEARVTDASRREITGNGTARVTRQRYYVYPQAAHNLYRPQDKVTVEFKAADANDQPVQTEGTVKITREYWYEIWIDPKGKEFKGDELKRLQSRSIVFPPPPAKTNDRPWQLKFRGYEHDDILTRTVKADTNGMAEVSFTPEREGYYRVAWSSDPTMNTNAPPEPPVTAETTVWVATGATTELGYQHGDVEIIVDKDTFRVGQKAPVMLSVPTNDRYVLFSVEGDDLYSYQLVHVTGTVKLVELPIEEKHVPNIFLNAAMVSDRQFFNDTKQVVVPPTKNFLTVDVKPDREQYQPREPGTFTITTRDDKNEPVSAEVAFGLVDESVFYIQADYAGDPRQFYFGQKRPHQIQTGSSFNQRNYAKLVEGEGHNLLDVRDLEVSTRQSGAFQNRDKDDAARELLSDEKRAENEPAAFGGAGGTRFYHAKSVSGALASKAAFGAVNGVALQSLGMAEMPAPAAMPAAPPGDSGTGEPAVQVRSDFRSTVFWQPDIITGKDGKATVKVTYPDSLTGWKATARAVTGGNQFGIADAITHTKQPLIVRLEAPRFFVVGDEVALSVVVNNNTASPMEAKVTLETRDLQAITTNAASVPLLGNLSTFSGAKIHDGVPTVEVPANGEARVDWTAHVDRAGEVKLKVTGHGGKYSDAMEKSYTAYEHGIEKFISKSGKVRGDDVTVKLNLPKERKAGTTTLTVQVTPSMAVTMLDALPYLIDYPYGCTEQTMSRFLPAVITAKTLKDLGMKPEEVMGHVFGGIETNSAAATHPKGKHDLHELDAITEQSLKRLYDFQHADGGWGWWKEGDSDHFMTAYVVWGLSLARDAGIETKAGVLSHGAAYLDKTLVDEEQSYDEQAWMLHALSVYEKDVNHHAATEFQTKAFDNLWKNRDQLNAYTRSLLALSAHNFGYADKAKILVENLENGVKRDNTPDTSVVMQGAQQSSEAVIGTAHWGEDGVYWRWSDGGVETTAFALRALLAIDPQNKLIEPVSNWLIKNRRGAQWSNTRDTAIAVLTMNDYLRASGELSPELEYELLVNGKSIAKKKVSGAEVFSAPSQFAVDGELIHDGENDIRIVRKGGKGAIYFAANAKFFSLEEPITPAGNEIFARRQYYKISQRPTLLKGFASERLPLNDGESVASGDRVETVIMIEAKNNYEYLLFEDLKPAGLEAVEVRSGEPVYAYELKSGSVDRKFGTNTSGADAVTPKAADQGRAPRRRILSNGAKGAMIPRPRPVNDEDHTGRLRWVYQELRDRKVALFIDKLPQGVWEIKYEMRAEVPGQFHALPIVGHAMYVPEIRCNGAEIRIKVEDRK